ncbi:MAG: hypothetical protein GIKADHBN_01293 [Phycisphaerales bacterium]|nr:hypothetical protein [Phycisphaerales bacterium]
MLGLVGWTAIETTLSHPVVEERNVQVVPPSMDLYMPMPPMASPLKTPSPVPAYMMLGLEGAIAMAPMARFCMESLTGAQLYPPSALYQMPPETAPAHMRLVCVGWMTSDLVRPPMFCGPRSRQL